MTTEKKSFVSRVLDFVQGGDESKVKRFHKQLKKFLTKQIATADDDIAEIEDKIADRKEELNELVVGVDVNKLGKIEDVTRYIDEYLEQWDQKYAEIQKLELDKEELLAIKAQRKMQLDDIQ